ncbi:hypothetical protein JCM19233_4047 [Vibrio astriarenae]|nr:hypothetical protein JCM19233_4047 [Vibrio sp. C7]
MGLFSRLKQASPVTLPSNSKKQSGQHYETLAMQHLQRKV